MQRWWNAAFLAIGLVALGWMVADLGPAVLLDGMRRVGWGFALAVLVQGVALVLSGLALRRCARAEGCAQAAWPFVRAHVAGHAINTATPFGQLGEVTKYTLLVDRLPPERLLAALVIDNVMYVVTICAFVAVVPLLAIGPLGIEGAVRTALIAGAAAHAAIGLAVLWLLRRGVGAWPFRLARRLGLPAPRVERAEAWWRRFERAARVGATLDPDMLAAWGLMLAARAMSALEAAVILRFLGVEDWLALGFLATAAAHVVRWLTSFVPLDAGTAEGGAYLFFRAIGLPPQLGVVLELVKKVRRVIFLGVGVAILGSQAFRQALRARAEPVVYGEPPTR